MRTIILLALLASPGGGSRATCACLDGRVCGTGAAKDPFRCCNYAKDSCAPAKKRCSIEPDCCIDLSCADKIALSHCGAAARVCY